VRSPTRHWSFAAPKGWTLAPPEVAERIDAEMSRLLPDKGFTCVAVVLGDASRGTRGPNIQVQFAPADYRGVTLDQIDRSLKDTRDLAARRERERQAAGERVVGSEETPPVLDRANLRISSMGTITVPRPAPDPAEVIRFETIGFLGRDGVTRLIVYAPEAEFPAAREAAVDAVESFQYEKGWGWPEASPEGALRAVLRQSGVGLIAVVAVVVVLSLVFRKRAGRAG
jgi:hypothetical protein